MAPDIFPPPPEALSFAALFDAAPSPYMVLDTALRIVAVNRAYEQATGVQRDAMLGRAVFEVFPDNPGDPDASGVANVRASLERVLARRCADSMAIQKYDIVVDGAAGPLFEERYWSTRNTPLFGADGEITHIIHHTEDVTAFVRARKQSATMALKIDDQAMEIELANRRLREANDTLEQRVAERTSAQQLTEERLRASELRFRLMADSIPQIVWIIEQSGRAVYFNRQWAAYTGQAIETSTPAEVIAGFIHPDDRARTAQAWARAHESGDRYVVEHRIRSGAGDYRWFLVRADAWRDPASGAITMWFGTSTDVHERKLAESALGQREEQLRLAINAADVGEWDVDMASGAMYWPAAVKAMFGISPEQSVTLDDYYNGIHPDDRERTLASFARTADPAQRVQYDAEYRTIGKEDGLIRWVAAKGRGLFDDAGTCVRIIGTAIDITARKAAEEALRTSEERLRQADRKKDEFLAMLAHELRNPLAPIRAAADLLQMGRLNEARVQQTSQIIARQVTHLTGLVDDLLDVSRVTRGLVSLDRTALDIHQIITEAIEQASPILRARRHQLALQMSPASCFVMGDRKRLVQVLTNLLNNAGKYTCEGGQITVQSEVEAGRVLVRVIDNGIGMAPELIGCAFDLFVQAERSSDRSSGGLGLGLALVRSIVELHGGTVQCASDGAGQGSTFTVCLPVMAAQPPCAGAGAGTGTTSGAGQGEAASGSGALRIMLVDDNADAAAMLGLLLEASGHTVMVEHDALHALARSEGEAIDVYLLDIGLPDIDGNALARRLRSRPANAGAVLVAVTGYGQEQDRLQSASAGFDHHLLKPVDFQRLTALLAGVAATRQGRGA